MEARGLRLALDEFILHLKASTMLLMCLKEIVLPEKKQNSSTNH